LKDIGDARHRRLDRLGLLLFLDLDHDLGLEILHALAGRADQVDQHFRHLDEDRRLDRRRRLRVHFLAVAAKEHVPGRRTEPEDADHGHRCDDQLELALGSSTAFRRAAFCLIGV
jgi:hypothetical protein